MKIESYAIGMDSARTYSSVSTRTLSISYSKTDAFGFANSFDALPQEEGDGKQQQKVGDTTDDAFKRMNGTAVSPADSIPRTDKMMVARDIDSVRQQFVLYLWSRLFGVRAANDLAERLGITNMNQPPAMENSGQFSVITITQTEKVSYSENEAVSFNSSGTVTTADGRTIDFGIQLEMSRSFEAYYERQGIELSAMTDPLVLNFDGDVAGLSDQKFMFDLDADGTEEEISMLNSGSGFLALDRNNDGVINDGSELFGTKSGDGFKDLAAYDEDHNGWIDENDSIFDELRIWIKNEDGQDELVGLKDKNVGAIYLDSASTDYTLRGNTGNVNGAIRRTGVFLYEDGMAGVLSHLDIAN